MFCFESGNEYICMSSQTFLMIKNMIKEVIDTLILQDKKRGYNSPTIILDRGTIMDLTFELKDWFEKEPKIIGNKFNLESYFGYKIIEYRGSNRIHIEFK